MPKRALALALAPVCALSLLFAGCAAVSRGKDRPNVESADAGAFGDFAVRPASEHGAVIALAIAPAAPTVRVTDLTAPATLALSAVATFADQTTGVVPAEWRIDRPDLASIGADTGLLSTTDSAFGVAQVTAYVGGLSASTPVTVELAAALNPAQLAAGDQAKLASAGAQDPAIAAFAYPYDATVFPKGLLPPELMWNGGAAGDRYRVHLSGPHLDLSIYTTADPPSRYTLSQQLWDALTTSAAGGDVTVELSRLVANGNAYHAAKESWHIADANLRGSIYYWSIAEGQIIKLDLATGRHGPVFDSGPSATLGTPLPLDALGRPLDPTKAGSPPWQDNGKGKRCVGCHSVSRDGSTLVSMVSRASSGPLGVVDLRSGTLERIGNYDEAGDFAALTPDGKLAVLNTYSTANNAPQKLMHLVDTTSDTPVASALDLVKDVCDPAFSPDGTAFAFAGNCDPGYGYPIEFRTSDLMLYDFIPAQRSFVNLRTVEKSRGLGDAIAFPSFSPDSRWIFYQRGDYSRAKYGQLKHGVDDLYVARAQAGGIELALDNANGRGVLPADSQHLNYAPTVNPIAEGGYFWVVFTSPRDYGNRMTSPAGAPGQDATYQNRKQLWVTAVDANIDPQTLDPSHPAFWLPGQDLSTINMFGYWSLSPCKPTANAAGAPASCSAGFECCSGFCRDSGSGPMCVDQAPGCHDVGEKCAGDADCCDGGAGVSCVTGVCQKIEIR